MQKIQSNVFRYFILEAERLHQGELNTAAVTRTSSDPKAETWERLKDLKSYFYQSGFKGTNPETVVYSFFESDLGVSLKDWVSIYFAHAFHFIYH